MSHILLWPSAYRVAVIYDLKPSLLELGHFRPGDYTILEDSERFVSYSSDS
jgi:hypothetical protein